MSSPVEQIKERLDVADIVGEYVQLSRAGKNLKARCPFHAERTPSFVVSSERGTYYCFGCGAKGDVFSFVQAFEGVDFRGALEMLAHRAGVELRDEDPEAREQAARLRELMATAAAFYRTTLAHTTAPRQYLTDTRGLTEETIEQWQVGFAPAAWRATHDHLLARGYSEDDMQSVGLIKERNGRRYDTFRSRIMFPIADTAGRVVAFSGRHFALPETADADEADAPPKYVNSPETSLYAKSHILFGLDRAKQGIRRLGCSIVVEGQVDVLMAHQAGYTNTVALSGTALTNDQLTRLHRLSGNCILALDADAAGATALQRSAHRALALGMDVKVASLPDDADPADVIRRDPDEWRTCIREARHVVDAVTDALRGQYHDARALRREVSQQVLPLVAAIPDSIDRAHFIRSVADAIDVPEQAVTDEVQRMHTPDVTPDTSAPVHQTGAANTNPTPPDRSRREYLERQMLGLYLWQRDRGESDFDPTWLHGQLQEVVGAEVLEQRLQEIEAEQDAAVFEAEEAAAHASDVSGHARELLEMLHEEYVKYRYDRALQALREAERDGDTQQRQQHLQTCQELSQTLANIHTRKQTI